MKESAKAIVTLAYLCVGGAGIWASEPCRAADHGDTPVLISAGRHDARITDLFAFTRGDQLVLIVSLDPSIPPGVQQYQFASDLRVKILIDNDSEVAFDDAADLEMFGGTILGPHKVQKDLALHVEFDMGGEPILETVGIPRRDREQILLFAGLRDDPFIRAPRTGRNIAAIVIELPLDVVLNDQDTLLIWATSAVDDLVGPFQDLAGRALRSQFPENFPMNSLAPKRHEKVMNVPPDVIIYDTLLPAAFPNGRELADDVVDLVGDPRVLNSDFPFPAENDLPFLDVFPYLAPPHPAP